MGPVVAVAQDVRPQAFGRYVLLDQIGTASQCASGLCADGVCCDAACDQVCQTCGSGACLPVKKADDVPECAGATTCNPRGSCVTR